MFRHSNFFSINFYSFIGQNQEQEYFENSRNSYFNIKRCFFFLLTGTYRFIGEFKSNSEFSEIESPTWEISSEVFSIDPSLVWEIRVTKKRESEENEEGTVYFLSVDEEECRKITKNSQDKTMIF